jgi:uncharacterized membrane protein
MENFWSENKGWIIPILVFVWAIYSAAVYKEWVAIWTDKPMGTLKKVGYSIRALADCAGPVLVATWKQYGGSIVAFIIKMFKVRLGLPVAGKRIGKALKR